MGKDDIRVEAIGSVDELNSAIGVAIAETQNSKLKTQNYNSKLKTKLSEIQSDLFLIGSCLANTKYIIQDTKYLKLRVGEFEQLIDQLTEKIPLLQNFILPGGGKAGASLHLARTVCRRGERRVIALAKKEKVSSEIIIYLNRLSDLLFTMARFVNYQEKQKEVIWVKSV